MEENKQLYDAAPIATEQEKSKNTIDFAAIYTTLILNWRWFLVSLAICLGSALIYLRYTTPIYRATAKMIVKEGDKNASRSAAAALNAGGIISNTSGLDTELEILSSRSLAADAVRDLKLYVNYSSQGRFKDSPLYKNQPVTVDIDPGHLENLQAPINLTITKKKEKYKVEGTYFVNENNGSISGPYKLDKTLNTLPATIGTRAGVLTFSPNPFGEEVDVEKVTIISPDIAAYQYAGGLAALQGNKGASIITLAISDAIPQRAKDYLEQVVVSYNRQANEDKNEIATNTEAFINSRLEKISAELGSTEGELENFKKSHGMVELRMNAGNAVGSADAVEKELQKYDLQVELSRSLLEYMNDPANKYQSLPSNVGLADGAATALIGRYNEIVLQRNRLLRSASEDSPTVKPLTAQLDDLVSSIIRAMVQGRRSMEISRNALLAQQSKYQAQIYNTPTQERMLSQIGRQQEVKSGLFMMLLQKREENSISLAATANKGKLIDKPEVGGKISPNNNLILLIALSLGFAIPALILLVLQFFRYRIEGHDDVARVTDLPIIADIAVASEVAKTKADIVVHENSNNAMEEIFRSMRTNIQFMLHGDQKTIMFTSSMSGEGKTFIAANLSVSFALLGKKVLLVGLDIRRPRLGELFEMGGSKLGITNLLLLDNPTKEEVRSQIVPSGINNNLDLLLAGPIPPNPTELLTYDSLVQVFNILKAEYDYILIDTAPVGLVTDTLQIGRVADVTCVICRADYTPKESFVYLNSLHTDKKLPNMCVAINGIDLSKRKYGYYYGYGKYGKYGRYTRYGRYGYKSTTGVYGSYSSGNTYRNYLGSQYGNQNDDSIKH